MRLDWRAAAVVGVVVGACGSGERPTNARSEQGQTLVGSAQASLVDIVGMTNALSTPAQRHMVRLQTTRHANVYLLAAQNDGYTNLDEGLLLYRSDDGGTGWFHYADIAARPDPAGYNGSRQPPTLHLTADLLPVGSDVAAVYSYDTTSTGFPTDAWDPDRAVYFQWWRYDGVDDWVASPRIELASPAPGQAYHRAEVARDGQGRIWVQAFLRQGDCTNPGSSACAGDLVQVWVSTDGGSTFQGPQTLARVSHDIGGGRLAATGSRLVMLWADTSMAPAQLMTRNDADPVSTWSAQRNAFPDGAHIYHGASASAVPDGAGGLHLVYKEWVSDPDNQQLYYRYFDGNSFGPKTKVGSLGDWAQQPAVTRSGSELYVCANQTLSPGTNYEMRAYRLGAGFTTWTVVDGQVNGKAYPAAPERVPATDTTIPCAFGMGNQSTDWWGPGHSVQAALQPVQPVVTPPPPPPPPTPVAATPTFSPAPGTYSVAQTVTISDATSGATIYYTTNGALPTTSSTRYTGPLTVNATTTISAIAVATGYTNSAVATATWTIQAAPPPPPPPPPPPTPVAATPTFSPAPGTYSVPQTVTISDATSGATIYYTTNGTLPTTSSTRYTGPFTVSATTTISAVAVATGYTNSAVATATWTIQAAPPPPPPPPSPVALFSDDFNRTTGLGPSWDVWYGGYTTDGANAVSSASPIQGNWASIVPALGTNDYAVSATVSIPSNALYSGVVARGNPSDVTSDLYAAQLSFDGNVNLYRRNAWNWTLLGSTGAGITAGPPYQLQLAVTGTAPVHLEVSLNGVTLLKLDDASPDRVLSGIPGIESYDPGVRYDRFDVFAR